ncbi:MAG: S53 family peptidase [Candidatus Xenobia bacterium]
MNALSAINGARPRRAAGAVNLPGSECPNLSGCSKQRGTNPEEQISTTVVLKDGGSPAAVEAFAKANGLAVTSSDSRLMKLSGTAQQYQKAFDTKLAEYKDNGGKLFRAYEGSLRVPPSVAGSVEGVLGLYNRPIASPRNSGFKATPKDMPTTGYTAPQIGRAYNFPKGLDGTGQTISIIEMGGNYSETDMQAYFKKLGIAEPKFKSIPVDGATPTSDGPDGADGEVALDMEVAGAIAPKATINVYFAPNTEQGFVDAVAQAAKDTPKNNTLSISWGSAEDNTQLWSQQALNGFNDVLKDTANAGINTYVAAGDNGSDDGVGDGANHVDFPSASPWTIGAGGTTLTTDKNGNRTNEITWGGPNAQGATGGGVSNIFPMPDFQKKAGVPKPTNPAGGRGVPDVAGDADPASGYDVLVDGQEGIIGGTSAVAPLYAGLTALIGQGAGGDIGYLNPIFYNNPGAFTDITSGTNGNFNAGPGWDATTGMGVADGTRLLAAVQAAKGQPAPAPPAPAPPAPAPPAPAPAPPTQHEA